MTTVNERPRTSAADAAVLFWSAAEIQKFEDAATAEEERGLPPGSLDDDTFTLSTVGVTERNKKGGKMVQEDDLDENDDIEFEDDYEEETSFDKGGFGSDSNDNF